MNRIKMSTIVVPLFTIGCGDLLKDPQTIEEPRVLAVQVGDEGETATPAAGEQSVVRFLLAGPDGPQDARVAYRVCEAIDSARGVPTCGGEIFADGSIARSETLQAIFQVPEGLAEGTRIAVLAVACESGAPSLAEDPVDWACSGGDAINVSFDAWVGGDETNSNPDLAELSVEVDGEPVTLEDTATAPQCSDSVAQVAGDKKHDVAVRLGDGSREGEEWLQVSHFATRGSYERQFSILEPEEELNLELEWTAPEAGATKHYLVVRDGLGGVSFATWSVCAE